MGGLLKKTSKKSKRRYELLTFLRAQLSAQFTSMIDFAVTILLAQFFSVYYVYATFLGSVTGGVVNCFVNYEWTFNSHECKRWHVIAKYVVVWIGSVMLNTSGTYYLTEWLKRMKWVQALLSHYIDDVFIVPKLVVAVAVAVFWNYFLQRVFVYRNVKVPKIRKVK